MVVKRRVQVTHELPNQMVLEGLGVQDSSVKEDGGGQIVCCILLLQRCAIQSVAQGIVSGNLS